MHKFKTELELEKVDGVHVYLREDSDWITVQESMSEQLEEVLRENLREANEMLLGINDVYENESIQSNDVQQRKRNEQNVKPDYYQFDDFEMYEIVEAICKHYNPVVAAWIGQAIQYIGRAPRKNGKEDIGKARDMIERAFEVWDVK
ncbi:DUF3310 domain-containing protein [Staphylococcus nepalensis]|uniref:DUF3310 domain-containing protein n=1 Tax=Staphylococcus nepalensis TaxID=214473 RepID=UPI001E41E0D9|nr:DUF3310 domain-containing protein [Staphylococcus nepalensis]MCD8890975.1 DUF3310 domain-containing protein [Staphylococcus nepalensis]